MQTDAGIQDRIRTVESFVAEWVADERLPGAALAIVDANGIEYADGFGARNLEANEPATPDTLYAVGSCTKTITAIAIMQLLEAGNLALEDPVDDYIPHLEDAPGDPVTIAELLSHTSGIPSDGSAMPLLSRAIGQGHIEVPLSSEADFRRHVQGSLDYRVTDRETFMYYNSGYTMLGLIVEAVTNQEFAGYVDEHILTPLGMERSTFEQEAFEATTDRMRPYIKKDDTSVESGFAFDRFMHAPGGLVSSVREMAAVIRLFLNEGTVDGTELVSADSVDRLAQPRVEFERSFDGPNLEYGYGTMSQEFLDDRLIGHGGSVGVATAYFGYLESAGIGVVLACTTDPPVHPMVVGPAVLAILDDQDPDPVVPHYRLMTTLEQVSGEYEQYRQTTRCVVERVDGSLQCTIDSGGMEQEFLLTPTDLGEGDGQAVLRCETVNAWGFVQEVRFELGERPVIEFERFRMRKVG